MLLLTDPISSAAGGLEACGVAPGGALIIAGIIFYFAFIRDKKPKGPTFGQPAQSSGCLLPILMSLMLALSLLV